MDTLIPDSLKYAGALAALSSIYQFSSFLSPYITSSKLDRYHHGKKGSTWACVTGSSDGIGYGFATALLDKGFNVLLHGRNETKLAGIQSDLQKRHPNLQVRYVIADASSQDAPIDNIAAACNALPGKLTILINDVGGTPGEPFQLLDTADAPSTDVLINMNARFPAQVTRALLPSLIQNGPSLIMNIGSAAGSFGLPSLVVYSASKSFNAIFSEALRKEMAMPGKDVEVLGILVGVVISGTQLNRIPLFTCTAREMADYSLARVGCGQSLVWGWWRHGVQSFPLAVLPTWASDMFIMANMKSLWAQAEKAK